MNRNDITNPIENALVSLSQAATFYDRFAHEAKRDGINKGQITAARAEIEKALEGAKKAFMILMSLTTE
jgi:hypothetical protein